MGEAMSDDDEGDRKLITVWLNPRHQETLRALQSRYGASVSGAVRAGLDLLRKPLGLDTSEEKTPCD